jgi:lysophospholipase
MKEAPLFFDVAEGPDGGEAFWLTAEDGVRVRIGLWRRPQAEGTVFLFPGRTEYVEKYGRAAADLANAGLTTLTIDWRGQGLADRLADDTMSGHVMHFSDYQRDVDAMLRAAMQLDLPKPWYLLAHSMGGCIGLRALLRGLPVSAAAFSGPMWGIRISTTLRPVAWSLSWGSRRVGLDHVYAPGTLPDSYVLTEPFETNKLTRDRDMFDYMVRQVTAYPELALGGPSLRWLHEALKECLVLSRKRSPDLPALTVFGSEEDIVDQGRIHTRKARWPNGLLEIVDGCRHEVLMESRDIRDHIFGRITDFFHENGAGPSAGGARSASDVPTPRSQAPSCLLRQGTV